MITAVYLSAEAIQIVQGKRGKTTLEVQSFHREPLPASTIVNGMLMDEDALAETLSRLVLDKKMPPRGIDLLVDSGSILCKRVIAPALPDRKLLNLARQEFAEFEVNYEDLIYDYAVIDSVNPDGDGSVLLCTAVERLFIQRYIDLFGRCKIGLRSIDLAVASAIRLAQFLPEMRGLTYTISVLEDANLTSSLFVDGHYALTNRTRLLSPRKTPESAAELQRTLSSMMQFQLSQYPDEVMTNAYLCGLTPEEEPLCDTLTAALQFEVSPLPDSQAIVCLDRTSGYTLTQTFYETGTLLRKGG